jgi:hypothetical protein
MKYVISTIMSYFLGIIEGCCCKPLAKIWKKNWTLYQLLLINTQKIIKFGKKSKKDLKIM